MPPGFWEQYGVWIVVGSLLVIYIVSWVVWLIRRRQRPTSVPPEIEARRALAKWQGQPEAGKALAGISRITKIYFQRAFDLPAGEHTTAEINGLARDSKQIGPDLAQSLAVFLVELDRRKFDDPKPGASRSALEEANALIDLAEKRREALRESEKRAAKEQHARQS